MPMLESVRFVIEPEHLPLDRPDALALTSRGDVAFSTGELVSGIVHVVDSTGRLLSRWGRAGDGPGEIDPHGGLYALGTRFAYVSSERSQAVVFSPEGRVLTDIRRGIEGVPLATSNHELILAQYGPDGHSSSVRKLDLRESPGKVTHALDSDSLVDRMMDWSRRLGRWPAIVGAFDGQRLVIGNGNGYELAIYEEGKVARTFGRTLPLRHRTAWEMMAMEPLFRRWASPFIGPDGNALFSRDIDEIRTRAAGDTMPYFGRGATGFDYRGRLWVMGQASDSTFADIFVDTVFLGRLAVDCRDALYSRNVYVNGTWVAMSCATEDDDQPFTIRLFRIVEKSE